MGPVIESGTIDLTEWFSLRKKADLDVPLVLLNKLCSDSRDWSKTGESG